HFRAMEDDRPDAGDADTAGWMAVAAIIVVLWAGSFEIDRLLGAPAAADPEAPIDPWQLRTLWWIAWWATGGLVAAFVGRWRRVWPPVLAGASLVVGAAAVWLTLATVGWRLSGPPLDVTPAFNLQTLVGVGLAAGLVALVELRRRTSPDDWAYATLGLPAGLVVATGVAAIGLWIGTLELDRILADDPKRRLAAFSVWWGVYAIGLIAIGFGRRSSVARIAGLGLLAVTAVKVVAIDMAGIDNIWRVVSSAAIGLLLLGTSVAYAKFGAREREARGLGVDETPDDDAADARPDVGDHGDEPDPADRFPDRPIDRTADDDDRI
ncbi:MAG: DUF2339 domain-containing protein, partial [Actinomycetota bacterium]